MQSLATRRRKGFSLIEAAIVLGIVGLVIGGVWIAASEVTFRLKVNRFMADIDTTVSNIQKFPWKGTSGYTDLATGIKMGFFPAGYVSQPDSLWGSIYTSPGGSVGFNSLIASAGGATMFISLVKAYPRDIKLCIELGRGLQSRFQKEASSLVYQVYIDSDNFVQADLKTATSAQITSFCADNWWNWAPSVYLVLPPAT